MATKFIVFLAVAAVASAHVLPATVEHQEDSSDPHYSFEYGVKDYETGDDKAQHETRKDGVVRGQYSLVEPDGSRRIVDYTADDVNGFQAVVSKQEAAKPVIVKTVVAPAPKITYAAAVAPAPLIKTLVAPPVTYTQVQPQVSVLTPTVKTVAPHITYASAVYTPEAYTASFHHQHEPTVYAAQPVYKQAYWDASPYVVAQQW